MVHHVNTTDIHHLSQKHCQFIKLSEEIEGIFQMYSLCIKNRLFQHLQSALACYKCLH